MLTVVITSLCALLILSLILLCYICWESRQTSLQQFYMFDDNGQCTIIAPDIGNKSEQKKIRLFRHLSSNNVENLKFSSKVLSSVDKKIFNSECDLTQSLETTDAFEHAILRIEDNEDTTNVRELPIIINV